MNIKIRVQIVLVKLCKAARCVMITVTDIIPTRPVYLQWIE